MRQVLRAMTDMIAATAVLTIVGFIAGATLAHCQGPRVVPDHIADLTEPHTIATFSPQPEEVFQLDRYNVQVCTNGPTTTISGGLVYAAAGKHFNWVSQGPLQKQVQLTNTLSPANIALDVIEALAWTTTAVQAANWIKIKEQYAKMIPAGSAGLAFIGVKVKAVKPPDTVLPSNLLGPFVIIPANGCADVVVYGSKLDSPKGFTEVLEGLSPAR